jgi:putative PIN family toxin of toxin-antitoxin system
MDVLIDTNIVISAALFPNPRINIFLSLISEEHNLFLCSYSILEVEKVISRKFPAKTRDVELFLSKLRYTLVHTPSVDILGEISLRDKNDYPILASAIIADVDLLITGDRDFEGVDVERPEILTIAEFMEKYS